MPVMRAFFIVVPLIMDARRREFGTFQGPRMAKLSEVVGELPHTFLSAEDRGARFVRG